MFRYYDLRMLLEWLGWPEAKIREALRLNEKAWDAYERNDDEMHAARVRALRDYVRSAPSGSEGAGGDA